MLTEERMAMNSQPRTHSQVPAGRNMNTARKGGVASRKTTNRRTSIFSRPRFSTVAMAFLVIRRIVTIHAIANRVVHSVQLLLTGGVHYNRISSSTPKHFHTGRSCPG